MNALATVLVVVIGFLLAAAVVIAVVVPLLRRHVTHAVNGAVNVLRGEIGARSTEVRVQLSAVGDAASVRHGEILDRLIPVEPAKAAKAASVRKPPATAARRAADKAELAAKTAPKPPARTTTARTTAKPAARRK